MRKLLVSSAAILAFSAMPFLAGASFGYFGNLTETVGAGKILSVGLNPLPTGTWVVSSNSNSSVTSASLSGLAVLIRGMAPGSSVINVCDSAGSGCLQINVTVSSVLGAFTAVHPAGTWVLGADGKTIYYVTGSGLIPVPTWSIFLSNGGKSSKVVAASDADMSQPFLSNMVKKDSRVK